MAQKKLTQAASLNGGDAMIQRIKTVAKQSIKFPKAHSNRKGEKMSETKEDYKRNINLAMAETILTSVGAAFSMAYMTEFWNSIGMNQTVIGVVQAIFTIVMLMLDYPMGYVADRCNRKVMNIVGDVGTALTFVLYAFSKNVYVVIISECLLGVFAATTNGVDQSYIKYYTKKLDPTEELLDKVNAKISTGKNVALLIATGIGIIIAKYNLRLTIGISFIPYFVGGIIATQIEDFDCKLESKSKSETKSKIGNAFDDMFDNMKKILESKKTKAYLMAYIFGKEVTHSQIWLFTPMLEANNVSATLIGMAWILNSVAKIIGSKIAEKMVSLNPNRKFAIPMWIELMWTAILIFKLNKYTVWLFALNGIVNGMVNGLLITPLQKSTEDKLQASVMSLASTGARLLYAPLVIFTNYLGGISLQLAMISIFVLFTPLSIVTSIKLKKCSDEDIEK